MFGPAVEESVRFFQLQNGLLPNGGVDSETWDKLFERPQWTSLAALIPLISAIGAWALGIVLYLKIIPPESHDLVDQIKALPVAGVGPVRDIFDISSRFVWAPLLVVFLTVVALVLAFTAYLIYQSTSQSTLFAKPSADTRRSRLVAWLRKNARKRPVWILTIVALLVGLILYGALRFLEWPSPMIRFPLYSAFLPFIERALGKQGADLVVFTQQVFRAASFTASVFVVVSAGAALLPPVLTSPSLTEDLAAQWRRLTLSLYAGAVLLVAAILYQTTAFGWAASFGEALNAESADRVSKSLDELNRGATELAEARMRLDYDSILASEATAGDSGDLRGVWRRSRSDYRNAAARYESLTIVTARDTLEYVRASALTTSSIQRLNKVIDSSIVRAGGLFYSLLLAAAYFPGAMLLLERARDISIGNTEEKRKKWRGEHGIGFTFTSQWVKGIAVLFPYLTSIPAAQYILRVFE